MRQDANSCVSNREKVTETDSKMNGCLPVINNCFVN